MKAETNRIFEVYPVQCTKMAGLNDYRFICLEPDITPQKKLEKLAPNHEGLILLNKEQRFIGIQNHIGAMETQSNIDISTIDMPYYLVYMLEPDIEHIAYKTYKYASDNNMILALKRFTELTAKTGLKLYYHRQKVNPQKFDEYSFISKIMTEYLSKEPTIAQFYKNITANVLQTQTHINDLILYIINIGLDTGKVVPINIRHNVN